MTEFDCFGYNNNKRNQKNNQHYNMIVNKNKEFVFIADSIFQPLVAFLQIHI